MELFEEPATLVPPPTTAASNPEIGGRKQSSLALATLVQAALWWSSLSVVPKLERAPAPQLR